MDIFIECEQLNEICGEDFTDGFEATKLNILDNRLVFINPVYHLSVSEFLNKLELQDWLIVNFIEKVFQVNILTKT
jgi:hypothetical protein